MLCTAAYLVSTCGTSAAGVEADKTRSLAERIIHINTYISRFSGRRSLWVVVLTEISSYSKDPCNIPSNVLRSS